MAQKRGKLDGYQVKRLEDVGVVWDVFAHQWEHMFGLLVRFQQREGHCNVPKKHQEDGQNLGKWLSDQQAAQKRGKLDTYREKCLIDLGALKL